MPRPASAYDALFSSVALLEQYWYQNTPLSYHADISGVIDFTNSYNFEVEAAPTSKSY